MTSPVFLNRKSDLFLPSSARLSKSTGAEVPFFEKVLTPETAEYHLAKQLYSLDLIDEYAIVRYELLVRPMPAFDADDFTAINEFSKQKVCLKNREGKPLFDTSLDDFLDTYIASLPADSVRAEVVGGLVP